MRETFKSGSVGGAPGNRCSYLEVDQKKLCFFCCQVIGWQLNSGVNLPMIKNQGMDVVFVLLASRMAAIHH